MRLSYRRRDIVISTPQIDVSIRKELTREAFTFIIVPMATKNREGRVDVFRRIGVRLRYPYLFVLIMLLFVIDILIPDAIPLIDEAILGLLTVLFGTWRDRKKAQPQSSQQGPIN